MTYRTEPAPAANILVVDDTPANLQLLAALLKDRGYRVRPVLDGKLALQAARHEPPDLILLDINMPEMNGYEVCSELKADPRLAETPVIFISANTETMDKVRAFAVGGVDYVTKPFQFDEVEARVETHLKIRRLQTSLHHSNEQLQATVEALGEADQRKDEFLAMLAHELRNPLTAISSSIHILRNRGPEDPVLDKARQVAERQVCHMTRLLNDLLDTARMTQGIIELRQGPVEIKAALQAAVNAISSRFETRKQTLRVTLAEDPIFVVGDADRLQQVFGNLLDNAVKYTPSGKSIWLSSAVEHGQAVIRVRDEGTGISPEVMPYVFDLFVQAHRAPDRAQGGLGLGLTLVRRLVEMHGGKVEAYSDGIGSGSEFIVSLPLAMEVAQTKESPQSQRPLENGLHPRRILVVDDNEDAGMILSEVLRLDGHEVTTVSDATQAVDTALQVKPDFVLLDIGMPVMDGYQVALKMRSHPVLEKAVLVALTGYAQKEDLQRSHAAGFDHHMVKPVDIQVLRELIGNS